MADLNEHIVAEAEERSGNLLTEEFLELVERHHSHEKPGVSRETIERYADALTEEGVGFEAEAFDEAVGDHLTDDETWRDNEALYALGDGRVSVYPERWHEALGGSTDIREYIRFLEDEAEDIDLESGGAGYGIPESTLLDIVAVVGRTDREAAKARLEDLRESGEVTEDADQHPDARVRLAE